MTTQPSNARLLRRAVIAGTGVGAIGIAATFGLVSAISHADSTATSTNSTSTSDDNSSSTTTNSGTGLQSGTSANTNVGGSHGS